MKSMTMACGAPELEVHPPGDMTADDYRCEVWMPIAVEHIGRRVEQSTELFGIREGFLVAYCYVLDIEISEGKYHEAIAMSRRVADQFRNLGANLEILAPETGNVHTVLAIFRFETLSEYEDLMKRASGVEELVQLERQFHSMMKRPVYNLYSTFD